MSRLCWFLGPDRVARILPPVTKTLASPNLRRLYGDDNERRSALLADPGLENVWGFEQAARVDPTSADFLDPSSPFFPIKRLSTAIYREQLAQAVSLLPHSRRALDAGCGIGRSTMLASEHFAHVVAFDPCRANIDICKARCEKIGREGKELHWAGVEFLDTIPDEEFDFVLALEFVCYTGDPARTVAALARVLRPGGAMMLSVEAMPGALIAGDVAADAIDAVTSLQSGVPVTVSLPGRMVRLFDAASLADLCRGAGLDPIRIIPSHFFGEGPFWQMVDDERARDDAYLNQVAAADREFRLAPNAHQFARVLTAVAIKPRKA